MKSFAATCSAVALLLLSAAPQQVDAQASVSVSYQTFYNELAPYGQWIDYPGLGYVWQPETGGDFRPYNTNGNWVWTTEYGWTWMSQYSWGWAAFHYGRWVHDELYGWLWVPGNEWSPAWVCWRSGSDYYGWAPLAPETNIDISLDQYSPPVIYWSFVQRRNVTSPYLGTYCIDAQRNAALINATTIINNRRRNGTVFSTGPRSNEVENYTHVIVKPAVLHELTKPGRWEYRNNELAMYKPAVTGENKRNVPARFDRYRGKLTTEMAANGKAADRPENRGLQSATTPIPPAAKSRGWQSATTLYNGNGKTKEAKPQEKVTKQKAVDPGPTYTRENPPPGQDRGWQSATSLYNRRVREVRRRSDKHN